VNLKAKLCILKNYTLLLLGPSPFGLWCESCPCFTVRPLSFLLFTTGSSVFLLESPSSPVSLPRARDPAAGRPRAPAALRPSAPRSTRRAALPPAARVARAGHPSSLHVEPMSRAAGTPPRQTRRRRPLFCTDWVISLPLSFSPTNLALLQN
jgi:hypothetical protein